MFLPDGDDQFSKVMMLLGKSMEFIKFKCRLYQTKTKTKQNSDYELL